MRPSRPYRCGRVLALAGGLIFMGAGVALADPPTRVPLDGEVSIGAADVACTGIGQTKHAPKWQAYPIRIEFADAKRAYLAGEVVTVTGPTGADIGDVSCEGPWLLLRPPAGGTYTVKATLTDEAAAPRSISVRAPQSGQARFVITFPDAH
jgi:hypothetical protein